MAPRQVQTKQNKAEQTVHEGVEVGRSATSPDFVSEGRAAE